MNRWAAREMATFSPDLSPGARCLYQALDEYARDSGVCWPRQRTLATRLGFSERSIRYYLGELTKCGLIRALRSEPGGTNRYELTHRQSVAAPPAKPCRTSGKALPHLRQSVAAHKQDNESAIPPTPYGETNCKPCGGRGVIQGTFRGITANRRCDECGGTGQALPAAARAADQERRSA